MNDTTCQAERIRRAAPELLEACQEVARILRERDMGGWEARLLGIVAGAIAKATNEDNTAHDASIIANEC